MIIHSENNESDISINDDNICRMCYDILTPDDNISLLTCGHKFHYDCILMTYKTLKGKRQCPYCRKDGGYLDLYPGKAPTKYIHKEYSEYKNGNLDSIKFIEGKCKFILKRGKNVGNQCSFNIKNDSGYCQRHHNMIFKKNNKTNNKSDILIDTKSNSKIKIDTNNNEISNNVNYITL